MSRSTIYVPGFKLRLSDEERDSLMFNLALTTRHLAEVNSYLICHVLSRLGMSPADVDEVLSGTHASVRDSVHASISEHTVMPEGLESMLDDLLGGSPRDPPDDV